MLCLEEAFPGQRCDSGGPVPKVRTENSGLASELAPTRSARGVARELQQRQQHSLLIFFHLVVDSVQFFVDASPSLGFCPALNCSYRLSLLLARLSDSQPLRLFVASAQPQPPYHHAPADPLHRYSQSSLSYTLILSLSSFPRVFLVSFRLSPSPERALTRHGRHQCARLALLSQTAISSNTQHGRSRHIPPKVAQ
jgi:hypothetical protein